MNKATHTGECQVCGREQKLPNGKLSKHGYTTRAGFFEGTCTGTDYLPLEKSYDRIEYAIERATERATRNNTAIRLYKQDVTAGTTKGMYHVYRSATLGGLLPSGYYWQEVEFRLVRKYVGEYLNPFTKRWEQIGAGLHPETVEAIVAHYDGRYVVDHLEPLKKQISQYIAWQRKRIAEWTPRDCKPVPEPPPVDPNRVTRRRRRRW